MKPVQTQLARLLQTALPQARAELTVLPDAPQIALYLLNEDFSRAPLSPEAVQAVWDRPAYWAFCWASGQVLATILLQQPAWAAGKTVLDFGSGSGVVAIAAALAGAARVIACDIDPDAQVAIRSNAGHNHVNVEILQDFYQLSEPVDLIIAADVLYDRENLPWLDIFLQHAPEVLIADSRIKNFDFPPYQLIARRESTTVPDLDESDEFRRVNIFHARQGITGDRLME